MEEKYNTLTIGNVFLEELCLLRNQKGKYITLPFCTKLEDLSHKIAEFIRQQTRETKILKLYHSQPPEKISDNMVDLCLECIEIYLRKISCPNSLPTDQTTDQAEDIEGVDNLALQTLTHIACDLRALATYIKFTLYSEELVFTKNIKKKDMPKGKAEVLN